MSCAPGKVSVVGVEEVNDRRVFVLKFLQSRVPHWTKRVFFADLDPEATWFDELRPAFGEPRFFFEQEYEDSVRQHPGFSSGQISPSE